MGVFDDLIPQNATPGAAPPPAPRLGFFDDLVPRQRRASGVLEAIEAGFQGSATGLIARNKLPDVVLDPSHSAWYERALSSATGMVADLPEMILGAPAGAAAGGALGSAGGPVGAAIGSVVGGGAGAFAVPAAIREAYTQALTRGEITSASDFLDRAAIVLKTAGKEGLIGGLTFGAGGLAARTAGRVIAPAIGETLSVPAARAAIGTAGTGAELGTMVVAPAALEGKLPEPEDFLNAAIVLGGMKGAHVVAGKLRDIYAQTGVPPERVAGDAARDPSIKDDLLRGTKEPAPDEPSQGEAPPPTGEVTPTQERVEGEAQVVGAVGDETGIPGAYQPLADAERAREIVPGEKAYDVSTSPFAQEVPQAEGEPAQPTHVNYNRINSHEDVKLALARVSEIYEAEIQQQRRGTVDWAQTSAETAQMLADTMGGTDPTLLLPREPGTPAGAAELLARKQMVVGAAEAMMAARDELLAKGADATAEDHLKYLASIERLSMIQSEFLGARAEAGRALNILRNTAMDADRVRLIQDLIERYGKDPAKLATMMKEIDTVEGAAKMARELTRATTWEKIIEAWKAGLVSGPITQMANIMGNTTFMLVRPIVDSVAASFGMFRTAADRVTAMEPAARVFGNLQGVMDGARVAAAVFRVGEDVMGKAEQYRQAIAGPAGAVVQFPFKALSAADAFFRTMNERGEAYSLATREATAEGFNPLTREFLERVARLVSNPTEEMQARIAAAGDRFTFNTPLGEFGKSVQNMIRKGHLELLMPFVRTPVNIFKEMMRTSVFAPVMGEWRAAFEKGGAARDQALAEWAVGTGLMGATAALTLSGTVSGAGSPDPGKRQVKQAAGWQPYSVKIGDTWYSYQRLQPVGTLVGLAADLAETWDHVTPEESDKVPKMLAVAFANAVTNQTFLQGITTIVNVTSDPDRYGPRFFEAFAGSVVPGVVAQPAQMMDPAARRVDSMLDAIKSRIPGVRESLLPQRDVFGESVQAKERFGAVLPITKSTESIDKVRTEAARLDVSAAATPKKTHIGRGSGKLGDVKLTPEQQDTFARVGGELAHEILAPVVDAPGWDGLPDLLQRRVYAKAFAVAHRHAAIAALPPEERGPLIQQLTEKIQSELETE